MGLDYVELVLAVEETFQIHLEDEEVGSVVTFEDLHNLVLSKLSSQDSRICLTSAAFYRTRRAFVDSLGVGRRQVRTQTPLEQLLPRYGRRAKWRNIQLHTNLRIPELTHPLWVQLSFALFGAALMAGAARYAGFSRWQSAALLLAGFILGRLLTAIAPWLAREFPRGEETVGDLARDVLASNYKDLSAEVGGASKKDVWSTLCRVIAEYTGVDAEIIQPGAPLVETLRID